MKMIVFYSGRLHFMETSESCVDMTTRHTSKLNPRNPGKACGTDGLCGLVLTHKNAREFQNERVALKGQQTFHGYRNITGEP